MSKDDNSPCEEENARDYFVIRQIYEIKQLQRDMNEKMDTLVNTFNAHTLEDERNLGKINVSLSKLEEKDRLITKSGGLIWSAIISAAVAIGSLVIKRFLNTP